MRDRRTGWGLAASVLAVAALAAATGARASSDDAWDAFRKDVKAACLKAGADLFEKPKAKIDPFGSASYGLAILNGKAKGADRKIRAICVYDKKTRAVEIGGEM